MSIVMPHAIEAEKILLGGLIVYHQQFQTVKEMALEPRHFYKKNHELLYQNMLELYDQKGFLDLTHLKTYLEDGQNLERVGGLDFLASLTLNASTSSNIPYYANLVLEKAQLRQLIETTQRIAQSAQSNQEINEILDEAETKILEITRDRRTDEFRTSREVVEKVFVDIRDLASGKAKNKGIQTGYSHLDSMTRGFQPGDLIILAARPSVGKTALALNLSVGAALHQGDKSVAIFSLEMPAEQLMTRMLSSQSRVKSQRLQTGKGLTNDDWTSINIAVNDLKNAKIFIDDSSMTKMSDIFSKCRKLKHDHNLGMIVIDYIQLINSSGRSENRQQEVSLISRQLKQLARELNVPVIALSQLSRGVTTRTDKRPLLSDLRESGAIEQDADLVMMLYRENYENNNEQEKAPIVQEANPHVEVILAKHRNGPIGTVTLNFTAEINRFDTLVLQR